MLICEAHEPWPMKIKYLTMLWFKNIVRKYFIYSFSQMQSKNKYIHSFQDFRFDDALSGIILNIIIVYINCDIIFKPWISVQG